MLKTIMEYTIIGVVISTGISIAIGLLIIIVSSLWDFFFNTENYNKKLHQARLIANSHNKSVR